MAVCRPKRTACMCLALSHKTGHPFRTHHSPGSRRQATAVKSLCTRGPTSQDLLHSHSGLITGLVSSLFTSTSPVLAGGRGCVAPAYGKPSAKENSSQDKKPKVIGDVNSGFRLGIKGRAASSSIAAVVPIDDVKVAETRRCPYIGVRPTMSYTVNCLACRCC